ncbi:hypothetical protein [Halolamina sp.]|uniref:hypothetical protein n=1 Tax=Halolamina sp. TaxID=1940283 RepID=UPI000223BA96|nr:hypothetical protein Halar_2283 [halophilic archaeon DL31]
MTGVAELERGDIIWASDPLSDKGRPMLILGTPSFENHGIQLITTLLSTKTYHEESLVLRNEDYDGDTLGKRSYALPWSLLTLNSGKEVELRMTSLGEGRTDEIAAQSIGYLSP